LETIGHHSKSMHGRMVLFIAFGRLKMLWKTCYKSKCYFFFSYHVFSY